MADSLTTRESAAAAPASAIPIETLPEDGTLEVGDGDNDSAWGIDYKSETTSISSSIYRGIIENGRRYQTVREGEYWSPSDDKQFESMSLAYLVYLVLDSKQDNPYFRSPIGDNPENILDLGTGQGEWAIHVADRYPSAMVRGVDLFPPPQNWMPPNCTFEVDDIMKPWLWPIKFDLIHMRYLLGVATEKGWKGLYQQAYDNLAPGGWIEQVEPGLEFFSDDGSMPADSKMAGWGKMFYQIGIDTGKPMDTFRTMKDAITAAGFVNVQEQTYKIPIGPWPKHSIYREAGKIALEQFETGVEGYALYLLTKFGNPEPWTTEAVHAYLTAVKEELRNPKQHAYTVCKRVFAQKPM